MRKIKLENNKYYHIYNRGVDKRDIFLDKSDYLRFLRSMREFNSISTIGSIYEKAHKDRAEKKLSFQLETEFLESKQVEFICYCMNINHFHFIVRQLVDQGIEKFMHKIGLGYTKYFNNKHKRTGSLFGGRYKAVVIKSEGQLMRISCYINGNPEIHEVVRADEWAWSSYKDYLNLRSGTLCNKNIILKNFRSIDEYKRLTEIVIKDSQDIKNEERNM